MSKRMPKLSGSASIAARLAAVAVTAALAAALTTLPAPPATAAPNPAPTTPTQTTFAPPRTSTPDRQAAAHRANRGMGRTAPQAGGVGYYQDSNVAAVWYGASRAERSAWRCIRFHESRHSGHYKAVNGSGSSARGAGQWLRNTWRGLIRWVKINGHYVDRHATRYPTADRAPAFVQDAAFRHVWKHNGMGMWSGTGCSRT